MRPEENTKSLQETVICDVHHIVAYNCEAADSSGVPVIATVYDGRILLCHAAYSGVLRHIEAGARIGYTSAQDVFALEASGRTDQRVH